MGIVPVKNKGGEEEEGLVAADIQEDEIQQEQ